MTTDLISYYERLLEQALAIELSEHYRLNDLLWETEQLFASNKISKEKRDARSHDIREKRGNCMVEFESEEHFQLFCEYFGGRLHEEFLHEQEHAAVYKQYGVPCKYGFIKIISEGYEGLIPWITPLWGKKYSGQSKLRIILEALENATEKSDGDKQDIAAIRNILSA
jgi:hypothetical protein